MNKESKVIQEACAVRKIVKINHCISKPARDIYHCIHPGCAQESGNECQFVPMSGDTHDFNQRNMQM